MISRKPYLLLFATAVVLLICSFVTNSDRTLDINIHDTYYVTGEKVVCIILLMFTTLLGFIYFIFDWLKISMISILSKIHVYGTLVFLFIFSIYFFKTQTPVESEQYYTVANFPKDYNINILLTTLMIILIQILFIINIFASIIKKLRA